MTGLFYALICERENQNFTSGAFSAPAADLKYPFSVKPVNLASMLPGNCLIEML